VFQKQRVNAQSSLIVDTGVGDPKGHPYFSVIVCTYNRCSLVLSALASLRRQTLPYSLFEVVVVDNGSDDNTFEIIQRYVRAGDIQRGREEIWSVQCLQEPRNGLAYARNRAIEAMTGEVAVFLDDDTLADPYFLERLLAAYQESGADAIGGHVEIRWEAPRPYWLTEDMLDILGYFAPAQKRMALPKTLSFSSCCFSVKKDVLCAVGNFPPFLSRRLRMPACMETEDFCRRLHQAGYQLWYEPGAVVVHRITAAHLQRAYFIGRAYWQGRSEILARYAELMQNPEILKNEFSTPHLLRLLYHDLCELAYVALLQRPLLSLAGQASSERLLAAMAHARSWGRIRQVLQMLEHVPATMITPCVLLVSPDERDGALLLEGLKMQDVSCTHKIAEIPLSWLWRHRAHPGHPIGIIHLYQPGAFILNHWQRQRFSLLLWVAQMLGIRIITTDPGGWWQSIRSLRFRARRAFERKMLYCSNLVLTYTRQPEHLYADKNLRARVRSLPHPGYRGYFPLPLAREQAREQLGLSGKADFVYLCFAHLHSEYEVIHLIEAFCEARANQEQSGMRNGNLQLLLIGSPRDKKHSLKLLRRAASNSAIHLFMDIPEEKAALYVEAADAVVQPHFALPMAGTLQTTLFALSYERIVIVPELPRFQGLLPPYASIFYTPNSRTSLTLALLTAQTRRYTLTEKGLAALDARNGWKKYAHRLTEIYKELLF
jgi:GT2 family glycosyltransferase